MEEDSDESSAGEPEHSAPAGIYKTLKLYIYIVNIFKEPEPEYIAVRSRVHRARRSAPHHPRERRRAESSKAPVDASEAESSDDDLWVSERSLFLKIYIVNMLLIGTGEKEEEERKETAEEERK